MVEAGDDTYILTGFGGHQYVGWFLVRRDLQMTLSCIKQLHYRMSLFSDLIVVDMIENPQMCFHSFPSFLLFKSRNK